MSSHCEHGRQQYSFCKECCRDINAKVSNNGWVHIRDSGRYPAYGQPVIIILTNGVTQNITYSLDGADNAADWFEPYHFLHDDISKLGVGEVTDWIYVYDIKPPKESKQ